MSNLPELLTTQELSSYLKLSVKTISRYIRQKQKNFPAIKVGHQWRFPADEVVDWLERQKSRTDKIFRPKEIL